MAEKNQYFLFKIRILPIDNFLPTITILLILAETFAVCSVFASPETFSVCVVGPHNERCEYNRWSPKCCPRRRHWLGPSAEGGEYHRSVPIYGPRCSIRSRSPKNRKLSSPQATRHSDCNKTKSPFPSELMLVLSPEQMVPSMAPSMAGHTGGNEQKE